MADSGESVAKIGLASVLSGAVPFNFGNINDTYKGQILLDDGSVKHAVIKDLDPKELCNELFSYALAKFLDLPVPNGFLAVVDSGSIKIKKSPIDGGKKFLVFASEDVKSPNVTFRIRNSVAAESLSIIKNLKNWDKLGSVYSFDVWVANIDRHLGNILIGGPSEYWLIDHGHCFSGPKWSASDLDPKKHYVHRLSDILTKHMSASEKTSTLGVASVFCGQVASVDISSLVEFSRIDEILNIIELDALSDFLQLRKSENYPITASLLGLPVLVK
ncbi:MAG: HipA family kinase [Hyphomonas oceanitis]|uniref:HipA family kinase n=1 Tax=Hyphomonas oceanitis TaxID=81033 RepID=UPI003003871D